MPSPANILRHHSSASRSFVLAALRAFHLDPSYAGDEFIAEEEEPITTHRVRAVAISRVGQHLSVAPARDTTHGNGTRAVYTACFQRLGSSRTCAVIFRRRLASQN